MSLTPEEMRAALAAFDALLPRRALIAAGADVDFVYARGAIPQSREITIVWYPTIW
jgi:hypothetical protein